MYCSVAMRLCFLLAILLMTGVRCFPPSVRLLSKSASILGPGRKGGASYPATTSSISSDSGAMTMGVVSLDQGDDAGVKTPDFLAALSFVGATATEFTLIGVFLHVLQIGGVKVAKQLLPATFMASTTGQLVKNTLLAVLFFGLSVRSRFFSPLDNSRPKANRGDANFQRKVPSWMPPPLTFPIVWTAIALLRTTASILVVNTAGTLLTRPIFALAGHLAIGDTWNTVNNQERRLGTSALGVLFVLASVLHVVREYSKISIVAAKIIAPSAVWLTVATVLVWTIWRLNYKELNGPSFFPSKEEGPASPWHLPLTTWNS